MKPDLMKRLEQLVAKRLQVEDAGLEIVYVKDGPDGTIYVIARTGRALTPEEFERLVESRQATVFVPIADPNDPNDHEDEWGPTMSLEDLRRENAEARAVQSVPEPAPDATNDFQPEEDDPEETFFNMMYRRLWGT